MKSKIPKKPSVHTSCVASSGAAPDERIVEISFPSGKGCLVSLREVNGIPIMEVYRADPELRVYDHKGKL